MAAAVEVQSVFLMSNHSPALSGERLLISRLETQNAYLAFTVVRGMLKADNLNGFHRQPDSRFTHEVINEPGFKEAVITLEKSCHYLKETKAAEMERLVATLDITDSQLCTNYQRVADHLMAEDVRFGRIGSLFFFTYILCKRLHLEGRQREIESVVDWLTLFLTDKITPWLMKNYSGKWVSVVCDVAN